MFNRVLNTLLITLLPNIFLIIPLSVNPTKWSNTLKQFVGCCLKRLSFTFFNLKKSLEFQILNLLKTFARWNTVISPNFLMWKLAEITVFTQCLGEIFVPFLLYTIIFKVDKVGFKFVFELWTLVIRPMQLGIFSLSRHFFRSLIRSKMSDKTCW